MNAAVVHAYDSPPSYTIFADPVAGEGEQLVTVAAAGLHQIVRSVADGSHYMSTGKLPFIPGVDGTGRLADGSHIYFGGARFPYGTFCEKTVIGNLMVVPLPGGLDEALAAGIANPGMSSWMALDRAHFTDGEAVLILGATGASGQLAVQIAKRRGASRVIAAGRNPESLEALKSLGADAIVSLAQPHDGLVAAFREAFALHGATVVLDYLWGGPAEAALSAVAQKGSVKPGARVRYVQIGNLAAQTIPLDAHLLRSANLELLGSGFGSGSLDDIRKAIAEFFAIAATQPFAFNYKAVPLSAIAELWTAKESARLVFQP